MFHFPLGKIRKPEASPQLQMWARIVTKSSAARHRNYKPSSSGNRCGDDAIELLGSRNVVGADECGIHRLNETSRIVGERASWAGAGLHTVKETAQAVETEFAARMQIPDGERDRCVRNRGIKILSRQRPGTLPALRSREATGQVIH